MHAKRAGITQAHRVPFTHAALLRGQELRPMCVPGGTHSSSCVQIPAQNTTGSFLYILRTQRWKILAALPERCSASPWAQANPAISLRIFSSKKLLPSHRAPETAQCDPQGLLSLREIQQQQLERPFPSRIFKVSVCLSPESSSLPQ